MGACSGTVASGNFGDGITSCGGTVFAALQFVVSPLFIDDDEIDDDEVVEVASSLTSPLMSDVDVGC